MPATLSEGRETLFETMDAAKKECTNKGRFAKGNPGGPGNPFARQVGTLRSAMLAVVQPEDLQQIIRVLIALAIAGDLSAARLVLQYTVGKPAPAPDPDRADIDEAKLHLEGSTNPADVEAMLRSMPPNFVNVMAEEVRPIVLQKNFVEAERLAAEQAADRARREAEMTAEEDAWEAQVRSRHAPRAVAEPSGTMSTHSTADGTRSVPATFSTQPPSANGPAPSANGSFEALLRAWAREGGTAPLPKGPLG